MMKPHTQPFRRPEKCLPRGASLIPLVTGRLLRSNNGSIHMVTRMPTSRQLRVGLMTWSMMEFPRYFATQILALPAGALAAVTPEDLHLANSAYRKLTKQQAKRLPISAGECERRLAKLAGWGSRDDDRRGIGETLDSTTRLYTLLNWEQERNADVDWNWMVQWLVGESRRRCWQADMARCQTRMTRPTWWQQADRMRRILAHQVCELNSMRRAELVTRVQEVHAMNLRLQKKTERFDLDTELPWLSGSCKSLRKWLKRQGGELSYGIERMETNATHTAPATLAIWALLGGSEPLPSEMLLRWLKADDQTRINGLLDAIDQSKPKQRRKLVALEETLEDVPTSEWSRIAKSRLPKPELKRLLREDYSQTLERRTRVSLRTQLKRTTGYRHWPYAGEAAAKVVQTSWKRWAQSWPKGIWKPELCCAWADVLRGVTDAAELDPKVGARWSNWLRSLGTASQDNTIAIEPIDHTDRLTQATARRLALYRRVLGHQCPWPNQLRSRLERRQRWLKESTHLRELEARRSLHPKAKLRLQHLHESPPPRLPRSRNLRQRLLKASGNAALEAAQRWLAQRQQEQITRYAIAETVIGTADRRREFLTLCANLPVASRQMLIHALAAAGARETGYKEIGPQNQAWLAAARDSDVQVDQWLQPNRLQVRVGWPTQANEQAQTWLTIRLTSRPEHVLWMGRPFDSCLDLRGGAYCESVVPNFMDANKQLLVLLDDAGKMVGRKLLAISRRHELLGYRLYLASGAEESKQVYEAVEAEVQRYCQDLANRVGLVFGSDSEPQELHGSSWYDDGTHDWDSEL